jgi:hypothetical protein
VLLPTHYVCSVFKIPYLIADLLIELYADQAVGKAALRAIEMRMAGNLPQETMWLDLLDAVVSLQEAQVLRTSSVVN